MKLCPFCAEEIQDAAIVCKHCGRDLAKPADSVPTTSPHPSSETADKRKGYGVIAIVVGLVLCAVSSTAAGFGILVLWVGFATAMSGGFIRRFGLGFVAALFVGAITMALRGTSSSAPPSKSTSSSASTNSSPATASKPTLSDADCSKDLKCWGEKHMISASVRCQRLVETMAKNNFEWTDGFLEPKFSHYRWKNQSSGVVTYIGDKIKYQNGFGAWIIHTYECDFEPAGERVVDVRASAGQLR